MNFTTRTNVSGWVLTIGRNRALAELRKGYAFHFAGDQHLASVVHHGIDDWRDAGFSFCVPNISAGYPRSWLPDIEGLPITNRPVAGHANTGDYRDGLGHPLTVYAIGNPAKKSRLGRIDRLHDKASGFGVVRMNKSNGTIAMECFRLQFDAGYPKPEDQLPGWPKAIRFTENYARQAAAYLPEFQVRGMKGLVVQVTHEQTGEIV